MLKDICLSVPPNEKLAYLELILKNHDVFSRDKNDLGLANHYKHSIALKTNEPLYIKQFKIPDTHRKMLEQQVKEWLKLGIIQRSNSKYNSPVFIVPKKEPGQFRFVQDFRKLNQNSLDDKYCMKDVNECIGEIGRAGSTIFSTLDLTSGFWQMPLDKSSREYTAFTIPGMGQFEWLVSAMGLKSCPAGFQRLVELAMRGLANVIVYIDDLILHSHNHNTHRLELQQLFDRLRKTGLKVNLKKCHFGSNNVNYLGFRLTPNGILPGTDKLQAVREATPPRNVHQVRSFLGLCNFFRSHVRNFSFIATPLNQLTRKDCAWRGGQLNEEALKAFNELKSALCSEPVVAYPRKDRPYSLIVDAATGNGTSEGGIGAILCQQDSNKNYCVIAYASRALVKHEKNYTPFLLEMMAAVWSMEHFDSYLRGRKFTLFTDHRPLEKLATVHKKTLNRLQEAMLEYDFKIEYKNGAEMPADFLSRNVLASIDVFNNDLPRLQMEDEFVKSVFNYITRQVLPADKMKAAHIKKVGPECFIDNDIIWRRLTRYDAQPRSVLLLPHSLATAVVQEAHGQLLTGHDGIAKTKERLLQSYYWPNMDSDVTLHIQGCQRCQTRRVDNRPKPHLLTPLPQCSELNQRIHVDLYGPLKTSESGKKYVLVMTDAFSKYAEVIAVPNKEAPTVSLAIFNRWICRFGCPLEIVSDGGKEFVNKISQELYKLLKIKHSVTTAYHPQCNAQVERFNQTVGKYLASFTDSSTLDWELYLAPLAFSYNTSLHRTTKATPFALTFGQEARLPGFPNPDIQRLYGESEPAEWYQRLQQTRQLAVQHSMQAGTRTEADHNRTATAANYQVGQLVWLQEHNFLNKNRKIAPQWTGPYKVVKVFDFGVIDILYKNKNYRVNVGRVKPFVNTQTQVAAPPTFNLPPSQQQQQQQQQHEDAQQNANARAQEETRPHVLEREGEMEKVEQTEMQQQQPKRGRGRPRKVLQEQPAQPQQQQPQQAEEQREVNNPPTTVLQEDRPNAAASLPERRITRAMARAAQQAGGEVQTGQVGEVKRGSSLHQARRAGDSGSTVLCDKFGIPIPTPGFKQPSHFITKRRKLKRLTAEKRNLLLTGDPGFPFDPVAYSTPWRKKQQQAEQDDNENNNINDDDNVNNNEVEEAESDVDDDEHNENPETDVEGEGFQTAAESEETETEDEVTIVSPQATPSPQRLKFTPPPAPGALPWRGQTPKAPSVSPPGAWGSSWRPNFFSGQGRLLETFRTVPHSPGSRPRPPLLRQPIFQPHRLQPEVHPGAAGGGQIVRPARLRTPEQREEEIRKSIRDRKPPNRMDL
jgi:transposase InsO family protein